MMTESKQRTIWQAFSCLFVRLILGLIFFMAGIFKVFELGPMGHAERFFLPYQDTFLPVWSLWVVGVSIPIVELLAGALLIIGWMVRWAAVSLGIVLVVVTFGHLLKGASICISCARYPPVSSGVVCLDATGDNGPIFYRQLAQEPVERFLIGI